jgi:signal transduction histidine kinase/CheY-like chemotaxis protein
MTAVDPEMNTESTRVTRVLKKYLLLVLLPAPVIVALLAVVHYRAVVHQQDEAMLQSSLVIAHEVDALLRSRFELGDLLKTHPSLMRMDAGAEGQTRASTRALLTTTLVGGHPFQESCALLDVRGNVVLSTVTSEEGGVLGDVAYVSLTLSTQQPQAYIEAGPTSALVIASPWLAADGRQRGVVRWRFSGHAPRHHDLERFFQHSFGVLPFVVMNRAGRAFGPLAAALSPDDVRQVWRETLTHVPVTTSVAARDQHVLRRDLAEQDWAILVAAPPHAWSALIPWWSLGAVVVLVFLGAGGAWLVSRDQQQRLQEVIEQHHDQQLFAALEYKVPAAGDAERDAFENLGRLLEIYQERLANVSSTADQATRRVSVLQAESVERSEYYRALFDYSPDALAVLEGQTVIDANESYRALFGDDLRLPFALGSDGRIPVEVERLLRRAEIGNDVQSSMDLHDQNGQMLVAKVRMSLLQTTGISSVLLAIRDVSLQRNMEMQLRHSYKMDAIGQLAGGVAHDFNNMLGVILPAVDLLKRRMPEDKRSARLLDSIEHATERAEALTKKLLSFSRKGKVVSVSVSIHELLQNVEMLLERAVDKRITISHEYSAQDYGVFGDPNLLESALLNLCINARDAMPEGGQLLLQTKNVTFRESTTIADHFILAAGRYIQVEVCDTGCGISANDVERIFEPFFTTKGKGAGTGLGLAAVFGAVEGHQGAVEVESQVGKGSLFRLSLPLEDAAVLSESSESSDELAVRLGGLRILLADDEELLRSTAVMMLEDLGYEVDAVEDGQAAVDRFQEAPDRYGLVILDQVMPRLNGLDAAQCMYAMNAAVPIVLCSGFPQAAEVTEGLRSVLRSFLQKPYSRAALLTCLRSCFVERGTARSGTTHYESPSFS